MLELRPTSAQESADVPGRAVLGVFVGALGVVAAVAGLVVVWIMPGAAADEHERLAALPAPATVSPTRTPSGQEILIDGRVALEQPRLLGDFVAYVKEEERPDGSDDQRRTWQEVERRTPPLALIAAGGPVFVVNRDYDISRATARHRDRLRFSAPRYRGLLGSDAVFVHGRVVGPGRLHAIAVGSGTRASHLDGLVEDARVAWWIGTGVGIAGAALVVIGGILIAISPVHAGDTGS
jgi:hypothetical protein